MPPSSTSRRPSSSIPATVAPTLRSPRSTGRAFTRFWGPAVGSGRETRTRWARPSNISPRRCAHRRRSPTRWLARCNCRPAARRARSPRPNARSRAIATMPTAISPWPARLSLSGRPVEALDAVDMAMRLNPHYPSSYLYQRGLAQFAAGRVDDAAVSLEHAMAMKPDDYWSQRLLLSTYGLLGRGDAAHRLLETHESPRSSAARPPSTIRSTIRAMIYWYPFTRPEDAQALRRWPGQGGRAASSGHVRPSKLERVSGLHLEHLDVHRPAQP